MKPLFFCLIGVGLITTVPAAGEGLDEAESLAMIVRTIDQSESTSVRVSLMRGMLGGLAGRRSVPAPPEWRGVSEKLALSDDRSVRDLSRQLSQIFGDEKAAMEALKTVRDVNARVEDRQSALRSLLMQQNEDVTAALESLLNEPELRLDAIRGYAEIENATAPSILLSRYAEWDAPLKRAIIETLASRKRYAQSLLAAIKDKKVDKKEVPAHVARSLNVILGDEFSKVFGEVRTLSNDRERQMKKYKKMITPDALAAANPSNGRAIFQKTCASCHVLYGTGGKIGPDLTGSNRANLDYILLNSVDPSYDVPDGYKMVLLQTVDGRILNGVVAEEDSQRVVLKTVEQPTVVIAKQDIESRKVSPKSMMPDGQLDQMKPQEVIDLIRYLRTTKQVELPQ